MVYSTKISSLNVNFKDCAWKVSDNIQNNYSISKLSASKAHLSKKTFFCLLITDIFSKGDKEKPV